MREQAIMNQGNPGVGELPKPILDRQLVPPKTTDAVRLFNLEDEMSFKKALVPVKPYNEREKEPSWIKEPIKDWKTLPLTFNEDRYNMDHNT